MDNTIDTTSSLEDLEIERNAIETYLSPEPFFEVKWWLHQGALYLILHRQKDTFEQAFDVKFDMENNLIMSYITWVNMLHNARVDA